MLELFYPDLETAIEPHCCGPTSQTQLSWHACAIRFKHAHRSPKRHATIDKEALAVIVWDGNVQGILTWQQVSERKPIIGHY